MWSFLKSLFTPTPTTAEFQFLICEEAFEAPKGQWYRLNHWKRFNYLRYQPGKDWSKNWKVGSGEEPVVGLKHDNRQNNFLTHGDKPDFTISIQREPSNKFDHNAIAVHGHNHDTQFHLGYLTKETARALKTEPTLDARLHSCEIPANGQPFRLNITVLVRSAAWRKKTNKQATPPPLKKGS